MLRPVSFQDVGWETRVPHREMVATSAPQVSGFRWRRCFATPRSGSRRVRCRPLHRTRRSRCGNGHGWRGVREAGGTTSIRPSPPRVGPPPCAATASGTAPDKTVGVGQIAFCRWNADRRLAIPPCAVRTGSRRPEQARRPEGVATAQHLVRAAPDPARQSPTPDRPKVTKTRAEGALPQCKRCWHARPQQVGSA